MRWIGECAHCGAVVDEEVDAPAVMDGDVNFAATAVMVSVLNVARVLCLDCRRLPAGELIKWSQKLDRDAAKAEGSVG